VYYTNIVFSFAGSTYFDYVVCYVSCGCFVDGVPCLYLSFLNYLDQL
jgi:hypothetical protein